jgi:beta-glucan synthesis-associated protein KRE6
MAHPSRRVPSPNPSRYYAVPQSPQHPNHPYGQHQQQQRRPSRSNRTQPVVNERPPVAPMPPRNDLAQGVATGAIGAGYGPYSVRLSSSLQIFSNSSETYRYFKHPPSAAAVTGNHAHAYTASRFSVPPSEHSTTTAERPMLPANTSTVPAYLWDTKDPDLDDALHNPDPRVDAAQNNSFALFSGRGWANVSVLVVLMAGLVALFAGYPIISFYHATPLATLGSNFGGGNGTGQIPDLPNSPTLIDKDTPKQSYTKTASDGSTWNLVFSDEFNQDGRTFWPGDDPYWEAVDLHYWFVAYPPTCCFHLTRQRENRPTGDLEWYNPQVRNFFDRVTGL